MKKDLLKILLCGIMVLFISGCGTELKSDNQNEKEEAKGNCTVTECIKKIEPSNTVEEIDAIIGFESTKSEYSEERTWKLDSKNWITLKPSGESQIIQATIDKESLKNDDLNFPTSSELKEMLNNGSFTYEELVEKLGGIEGTVSSKTTTSVGYMWVNKHNQVLGATFNNKSGKCTVASYR